MVVSDVTQRAVKVLTQMHALLPSLFWLVLWLVLSLVLWLVGLVLLMVVWVGRLAIRF